MAEHADAPVYVEALIFLAAAVVAVPLFRKLKLGSILGYLAAGLAIGPFGLGLFSDTHKVMNIAELGVVLFLFIIGLELNLSRLWAMRHDIFVLGTAQVLLTGLLATIYPLLGRGPLLALVRGRRAGPRAVVDRPGHAAARGARRGTAAARTKGVRHLAAAGPGDRAVAGTGGDALADQHGERRPGLAVRRQDARRSRGRGAGGALPAQSVLSGAGQRWRARGDDGGRAAGGHRRRRADDATWGCRRRWVLFWPACCSRSPATATSSRPTSSRFAACCSGCSSCRWA